MSLGEEQRVSTVTSELKTNSTLPKIETNYQLSPLIIKNNQHTIKAKFDNINSITLGKVKYSLLQFHLHAPSEHKLDGKNSDLELHLVHQNDSGEYAVLAILMRSGKENLALKQFFENLPTPSFYFKVQSPKQMFENNFFRPPNWTKMFSIWSK